MSRALDTKTLEGRARHYAAFFNLPDTKGPAGNFRSGPSYVMGDLYNLTFKDEFAHVMDAVGAELGKAAKARLDALAKKHLTPRDDKVFDKLLAERLAITRGGEHKEGAIGKVKIGARFIKMHAIEVESTASIGFRQWMRSQGREPGPRQTIVRMVPLYWPVYAGEIEERERPGGGIADPLPEGADPFPVDILKALNTRISNECALLACDAIVDNLDEGTGAAVIEGRSGSQPADPDTAVTGTLLFTLVCSDPAFGNAADDNPGGKATASSITDDSSADATGTLGYCRASSTNDGATPLDDHIDGEAGTSGADFNFNTLSIVSGATVSMSSWTVTVPES